MVMAEQAKTIAGHSPRRESTVGASYKLPGTPALTVPSQPPPLSEPYLAQHQCQLDPSDRVHLSHDPHPPIQPSNGLLRAVIGRRHPGIMEQHPIPRPAPSQTNTNCLNRYTTLCSVASGSKRAGMPRQLQQRPGTPHGSGSRVRTPPPSKGRSRSSNTASPASDSSIAPNSHANRRSARPTRRLRWYRQCLWASVSLSTGRRLVRHYHLHPVRCLHLREPGGSALPCHAHRAPPARSVPMSPGRPPPPSPLASSLGRCPCHRCPAPARRGRPARGAAPRPGPGHRGSQPSSGSAGVPATRSGGSRAPRTH